MQNRSLRQHLCDAATLPVALQQNLQVDKQRIMTIFFPSTIIRVYGVHLRYLYPIMLPSGNLTWLWKIAIYSAFTH